MSKTKQEQEALSLKIKKPSLKRDNDQVYKLDLNKKPEEKEEENAVPEQSAGSMDEDKQAADVEKVEERAPEPSVEPVAETKEEEISPLEEITPEEVKKEVVQEVVQERSEETPTKKLPENIEALVNFMEETGGTIEDYARLNRDYSEYNENAILNEYYKRTKPHLNQEEINFIMEDNFQIDEDVDDEREIKKKKLAYKEEIAKARNFLEETKSKYYKEIKMKSSGLTPDQQKAMDFFNRYNKEQEKGAKNREIFINNSNKLFNEDFKGFEYSVGEKTFRYNINNPSDIAKKQSSINSLFQKFLNKDGAIDDAKGYHKALYTAQNPDRIATHFYEQGKADAIRNMASQSKNIGEDVRPQANGDVFINGLRVKAISGVDSSKLKFKIKK
tara:strand:+ start:889 stop:2052 length:1164 start_codon:yes stop_codon:yes gene_type:complete